MVEVKGRKGVCSNQGVVKVLFCFWCLLEGWFVVFRHRSHRFCMEYMFEREFWHEMDSTRLSSGVVAVEDLIVSETAAYHVHCSNPESFIFISLLAFHSPFSFTHILVFYLDHFWLFCSSF